MMLPWILALLFGGALFILLLFVIFSGKGSPWRALFGSILGGLLGIFFMVFCFSAAAFVKNQNAAAGSAGDAGEQASSAPVKPAGDKPGGDGSFFGNLLRNLGEGGQGKSRAAVPQKEKRFEKLNFVLTGLDSKWLDIAPKSLGSDASYIGRNAANKQMLSVVIEPSSMPLTTEGLTEVIRSNAAGAGELEDWKLMEPVEFAGVLSPCVMYVVKTDSHRSILVNIHHFDRGYARQFVLSSQKEVSAEFLRKETIALLKSFSLIDPEMRGGISNPLAAGATFPAWAFGMKAGGSGWAKVEGTDGVKGQIWHGSLHSTAHLLVVPVALPDVEVDAPAMLRGLVSGSADRSIPENGVIAKELEIPGATGWEYTYQENISGIGEYRRLIRIIRRGRIAWLVDGGSRADLQERFASLKEAMDGFQLLPEPAGAMPENDPQLFANFCNQAGLSYFVRGLYSESRALFDEANRTDPLEQYYLSNALDALAHESKPGEILERIEKAPASLRDLASTQIRAAAAYAALGQVDEAKRIYQKAFSGGFRGDVALREAADFFSNNGSTAEAMELVAAYRKGGTNQQLDLLQSRLLSLHGMKKEALEIMEKLHAAAPGNQDILVDYSNALAQADRKDEALTVIRDAAEGDPESPRLLYQLGYQLADTGKYDEAVEVLEKAASISPKDQTIQEELAYVRSRLGRGHDSEIRTPLDAIPLPPSLVEAPEWKADTVAEDADRVNLRQVTVYDFKPGTAMGRTKYYDVVLLSARAVEAVSTLRFTFTPLSERIYVNRLEVLDAKGKVIAKGDEKGQYVTSTDGGEANGSKVLCVPVPGLVSGCRLRYEVTYRDRSPSSAFPFESEFFFSRYGVEEMAVCVKGDPKDFMFRVSGKIEEKSDGDFRIWSVKKVPVSPAEGSMPAMERFVPVLYLGPSGLDWKKLGDGYLEDIAKQLATDPDVESLARDIVSKATDDETKIRLLYRWVQQEFTYKAIEFGTRARIPHAAGVTCANRYGDCKDLSVVLHAMLRAVGIPSKLCLVNTSDQVNVDLPSLDQFNHMIVHLPAAGARPVCWLDPTERHHASVAWIGSWLEGRKTFVLEKGSSQFETVPESPFPSPHRVEVERRLEAGDPGDLMVHETVLAEGAAADGFRSYFTSIPAAERLQRFRELVMNINPGFTLEHLDVRNLQDQDLPLEIALRIKARDYLNADGSLKRLPVTWEREYLRAVPQDHRISPFAITSAWQVHSVTTGNMVFSGKSGLASKDLNPVWGDWQIGTDKDGEAWKIDYKGRLKRGDFHEASTYPAFFDFWESGLLNLAEPWNE